MDEPPRPPEGSPARSILAIPTDGRPLFRLLKTREGRVTTGDFQPLGKAAARGYGKTELERLGMSHFLTRAQAEAANTQGSRIARVALAPLAGHFARTGPLDGHVDVWAGVQDLVEGAETEE